MDDVRIFDRALTHNEIKWIHESGTGAQPATAFIETINFGPTNDNTLQALALAAPEYKKGRLIAELVKELQTPPEHMPKGTDG